MRHNLSSIGIFAILTCCFGNLASAQQNSSTNRSYNQRYDNSSYQSRSDNSDDDADNDSQGQPRKLGSNQSGHTQPRSDGTGNNQAYRNQQYVQRFSGQQNASNRNSRSSGSNNQRSNNHQPDDENAASEFIRDNDSNGDGTLSPNEMPLTMRSNFNDLDRNRDGYVTTSELQRHARQMESASAPADVMYVWIVGANHGQPNVQDLQQAYDMLQKIDQDGDGYITRSELRQQQSKVASQWINHLFTRLDQNSDEEISRNEAQTSRLGQRFDELDTNRDGYLTRSELRQDVQREIDRESAISETPGRDQRR